MRRLCSALGVLAIASSVVPACAPAEDDDDMTAGDAGDASSGDASGDDDSGAGGGGFHVVDLIDTADGVQRVGVDTVNAIRCTDPAHCVIGTYNFGDGGALLATSDGATLEEVRTAEVQFLAIEDTGAGWIALIDQASPFLMAEGDPTDPASWQARDVGLNETDDDFEVLNSQEFVRAGSGGDWTYATSGIIWHADQAPSTTTEWSGLWSPERVPPYPGDWDDLKLADDTICDSDPDNHFSPDFGQLGFASADLAFVIYPAGGIPQGGSDPPGACVSRDGGATFHQVPFPGLTPEEGGPYAIFCVDADHCWGYGVHPYSGDPPFVYYSTDASAPSATWQRAQAPADSRSRTPREIRFTPDGQHGWLVGEDNLAWKSSDGGATWTDVGPELEALVDELDWTSVFPLDADHVWLGGSRGILVAH